MEARWFVRRYTPTMDEYLQNAWVSVGGPAAIVHAYVLLGCPISKDALDCIKNGSELIYWASLITRLSDDLGTSEVCLIQIFAIKRWSFAINPKCLNFGFLLSIGRKQER